MSIAITGTWWLAALLAAGPAEGGTRLEEYGGAFKCKDEAVKAQVVRALSSGSPYSTNQIKAGGSGPEYDGKSVHVLVDKATSLVSRPGASGTPSTMRIERAGGGAALDVLMCRYRITAGKAWNKASTADLVPNGHLAKRMPTSVRGLGRAFALSEKEGASTDSVIVLVATPADGKSAELDVTVKSKGLQKRRKASEPKGIRDPGAKILAEAKDSKWDAYHYGQDTSFPEAEAKNIYGWDGKDFDCSYFVWLVYNHVGIDYEFDGTEGLASGHPDFTKVTTPRPGDLVVWHEKIGSGKGMHHVGIISDTPGKFWDNGSSRSVDESELGWKTYDVPRIYLRRKGL